MHRIKKRIADTIRGCKKIAISSHIRPDADSIGSGLALYLMIQQFGIDVTYCNTDPAPHPVNRLPHYERIRLRQIATEAFDLVILIEGGNEERTGQKNLSSYRTINIDHHETSSFDADINWVVPDAAAVGELIYELGLVLEIEFTHDIAFNLYAAIASDTGSFKYTNTTHRSLRIAADLVKRAGIYPFEVVNLLFNSNPVEKILMMTKVLSTLELAEGNRVALIEFRREFLANMNLKDIDTEDIITIARSINGVLVLLFFKEIDRGTYRISIRSRDDFSAKEVARHYQGGGHHHAAGFFFYGDLATAKRDILAIVREQLS